MVQAVDFIFSTEVVLDLEFVVGCQVHARVDVFQENGISGPDDLSLHFESAPWVNVIEHPHALRALLARGHVSNLVSRKGCTDGRGLLLALKLELLLEQLRVGFHSQALPVANVFVSLEKICRVFVSHQLEN